MFSCRNFIGLRNKIFEKQVNNVQRFGQIGRNINRCKMEETLLLTKFAKYSLGLFPTPCRYYHEENTNRNNNNTSANLILRSETRPANPSDRDFAFEENILQEIEKNFNSICIKIENLTPIDSVCLAFFPRSCIVLQQIDLFVSELWQNWWNLLENSLRDLEWWMISDLFFDLREINKKSKGEFLKKFEWEYVKKLVDISINNVAGLYSGKFEAFLSVIEQSISNTLETPTEWLNNDLLNCFESWVMINTSHGGRYLAATKRIGRILISITNLNVKPPSDAVCLSRLTLLCTRATKLSRFGVELKVGEIIEDTFNLIRIGQAFLAWNVNPDLYHGYWMRWYTKVNYLLESQNNPKGGSVNAFLELSFLIMLKYDCEKEFQIVKHKWCRLIKLNINNLSPQVIRFMLDEAERKYEGKEDLFLSLIPHDVFYVLNNCSKDIS